MTANNKDLSLQIDIEAF